MSIYLYATFGSLTDNWHVCLFGVVSVNQVAGLNKEVMDVKKEAKKKKHFPKNPRRFSRTLCIFLIFVFKDFIFRLSCGEI